MLYSINMPKTKTPAAAPQNRQELMDAGYTQTMEIWHTGKGDGSIWEKIVGGVRTYARVDTEGNVVPEE